jgi:hypothetical protein
MPSPAETGRRSIIYFEYVGRTQMVAVGGATGRYYRFDRPGSRVIVDPRDWPSLVALPQLRAL